MGIFILFAIMIYFAWNKYKSGSSDEKSTPVESVSPAVESASPSVRSTTETPNRLIDLHVSVLLVAFIAFMKSFFAPRLKSEPESASEFMSAAVIQSFDWNLGDQYDSPTYVRKNVQLTEPGDKIPGTRRYRVKKKARQDFEHNQKFARLC